MLPELQPNGLALESGNVDGVGAEFSIDRDTWATWDERYYVCRNDLGQELYDPRTGGCGDGLQEDRINRNQGAESTLAFLMSLAEMNLLESSLAAFRQAR